MSTNHMLSGFKVLDFTHVLAGPTATRMMAEMGADIVKVEFPPLGHAPMRERYGAAQKPIKPLQ